MPHGGAIWGVLGLLCLLAILPIDGVLLDWLHRGIGAMIGKGSYLLPFCAARAGADCCLRGKKGRLRLRGTSIALLPLFIGSIIHAFACANEYDFQ